MTPMAWVDSTLRGGVRKRKRLPEHPLDLVTWSQLHSGKVELSEQNQ